MYTPTSRAISFGALLALVVLWSLTACGGGGRGRGRNTSVDSGTPSTFSSNASTEITLNGRGFGASGEANVRLIAQNGTPFINGTSAHVDVDGTITSDSTIVIDTPLAMLCPAVDTGVLVHITLPDGFPVNSTGPLLTLHGAALTSVAPSPIPATVGTPLTITGTGFGPVGSSVDVTFTAASGTPFQGGTSASTTVTGTVTSSTTITVLSPLANADVTATVALEFSNGSCATSATAIATFSLNGTGPALTTSATRDLLLAQGDRVSFTVTATDAQADPVTLRLLNPPLGATLTPLVNVTSPATATLSWVVDAGDDAGPIPLVFEANDSVNVSVKSRLVVWIHLTPRAVRTVRIGDVTGDGKLDVVASARNADVTGVVDTGALYVWAGATVPSGTPTATLTVAGAVTLDAVATGGFRLIDVSGDGTLDVIAATQLADVAGTADAGAIFVWRGGVGLTGAKTQDATLTVGAGGAATGMAATPMLWQTGDVSGDGVADIVAAAPFADVSLTDTGSLYLWLGGASLTGALTPSASLVVTGAAASDELGREGLQLGDLTGDGVLDVLSAAVKADPIAVVDAGAMYMWAGGAGLTGSVNATATLTATGALANDNLGLGVASRVRLVDVTGDGRLDVIAAVSTATVSGATGAGAIFVWNGGATLTGAKTQDASLTVTGAVLGDGLGAGALTRLLVGDISGDGRADVVGVAVNADVAGALDAGAIYGWFGGATLTGAKAADATLSVAGAIALDRLGSGGTRLVDVSGDGVLDVVAAASLADVGGVINAGAVYVWNGGGTLVGAITANARLSVAGVIAEDRLGADPVALASQLRFAHVAGTAALDVIVPAVQADVAGVVDAGAVYVFNGGATLTGTITASAVLTVPGAVAGDRLGDASGSGVIAADVSGDGTFDVLAAAASADVGGVLDAGRIAVWRGGATLTGAKSADAQLQVTGALSGDRLAGGMVDGVAWDVFDVTGDSVRDVLAVAVQADGAALVDIGAGYLWTGGAALSGTMNATARFLAPSPANGDFLGRTGATVDLLVAADLTGEGTADVLIGASEYNGAGPADQGGLFLWAGGALTGTPAPTASLVATAAVAQDRLGN